MDSAGASSTPMRWKTLVSALAIAAPRAQMKTMFLERLDRLCVLSSVNSMYSTRKYLRNDGRGLGAERPLHPEHARARSVDRLRSRRGGRCVRAPLALSATHCPAGGDAAPPRRHRDRRDSHQWVDGPATLGQGHVPAAVLTSTFIRADAPNTEETVSPDGAGRVAATRAASPARRSFTCPAVISRGRVRVRL